MKDTELIDQMIHNATQPLYDKIMEHEKTISEFLNNKKASQ